MPDLPVAVVIGLYVLSWVALHLGAGLTAHVLPGSVLRGGWWWFRPRGFEYRGHLYRRFLQVQRWKHRIPEAGGFYAGGFAKRGLAHHDAEYAERFVLETCRAELSHWLTILLSLTFQFWNDWYVTAIMLVYALAVNLPCILIQRYNRPRLLRLLARANRSG